MLPNQCLRGFVHKQLTNRHSQTCSPPLSLLNTVQIAPNPFAHPPPRIRFFCSARVKAATLAHADATHAVLSLMLARWLTLGTMYTLSSHHNQFWEILSRTLEFLGAGAVNVERIWQILATQNPTAGCPAIRARVAQAGCAGALPRSAGLRRASGSRGLGGGGGECREAFASRPLSRWPSPWLKLLSRGSEIPPKKGTPRKLSPWKCLAGKIWVEKLAARKEGRPKFTKFRKTHALKGRSASAHVRSRAVK